MKSHPLIIAGVLAVSVVAAKAADVPSPDRDFALKAAEAGVLEVEDARIALKNATRPDLRDFARRMIADHTKAGVRLKTIASGLGLEVAQGPNAADQAEMAKLQALAGTDFDKAYIGKEIADHAAAVSLFSQETENGQQSQLKSFATATLPTLQDHYKMIKTLSQ
jgi:putative membrane protein